MSDGSVPPGQGLKGVWVTGGRVIGYEVSVVGISCRVASRALVLSCFLRLPTVDRGEGDGLLRSHKVPCDTVSMAFIRRWWPTWTPPATGQHGLAE